MISDLCWTNSRIFNPLCSSPLSPLLPLSRGYCFAPLFGWNKLLPPSSLYFPPFTSPLLCVPCFSFFFLCSPSPCPPVSLFLFPLVLCSFPPLLFILSSTLHPFPSFPHLSSPLLFSPFISFSCLSTFFCSLHYLSFSLFSFNLM